MISKVTLALLVPVAAASLFLAGIAAPGKLRSGVMQSADQLVARFAVKTEEGQASVGAGATGKVSDSPSSSPASSSPASSSFDKDAKKEAPPAAATAKPVPIQSLLISLPTPDKAVYGLQIAQFENANDANTLGARIKTLNLPFDKVLDVVDQSGKLWSIVPVGPYLSADAARTDRGRVAQALGLQTSVPVILLPPSKPE